MGKEEYKKTFEKNGKKVSAILRSLSHPTRLLVLCRLIEGEASVGELYELCDISQSAMSQFLNRMKADGLVTSRKDQTYVYYSIADSRTQDLLKQLKRIYCD